MHDSKNRISSRKAEVADIISRDCTSVRKKRNLKLKELSATDKIDIVHKVLHGKEKHAEVAEQFQVKDSVVHGLVGKARRDKDYLKKTLEDERVKSLVKETTVEVA